MFYDFQVSFKKVKSEAFFLSQYFVEPPVAELQLQVFKDMSSFGDTWRQKILPSLACKTEWKVTINTDFGFSYEF